jgi:hypothetical protein
MCPPGVDQTGRMPQVWQLICPDAKAVHTFPQPSASIPRSYLDRTDLSDILFNPERAWGAYSKLAIPAPLPTKKGRVVLPTRRAAPKLSRLETLPVELLSMIVGESGLEKSDVVALSLSSTML